MRPAALLLGMAVLATAASAQKGVDPQTTTIKEGGNKVTTRTTDVTRSFDWGKGKTKVRDRLARTGLLERIGSDGIYFSVAQAVALEQERVAE